MWVGHPRLLVHIDTRPGATGQVAVSGDMVGVVMRLNTASTRIPCAEVSVRISSTISRRGSITRRCRVRAPHDIAGTPGLL